MDTLNFIKMSLSVRFRTKWYMQHSQFLEDCRSPLEISIKIRYKI